MEGEKGLKSTGWAPEGGEGRDEPGKEKQFCLLHIFPRAVPVCVV